MRRSAGRRPRGRVLTSACTTGAPSPSICMTRLRSAGRRSSTTFRPLRVVVIGSESAANARPIALVSTVESRSSNRSWSSTLSTASWSDGARSVSSDAPVTSMPSGRATEIRADRPSTSTGCARSRSRYSAMLSCPVPSANPKLTFGRGEKPWVNASGSCSIRNARSNARATSRCDTKRTLPSLVNRKRTGTPSLPLIAVLPAPQGPRDPG